MQKVGKCANVRVRGTGRRNAIIIQTQDVLGSAKAESEFFPLSTHNDSGIIPRRNHKRHFVTIIPRTRHACTARRPACMHVCMHPCTHARILSVKSRPNDACIPYIWTHDSCEEYCDQVLDRFFFSSRLGNRRLVTDQDRLIPDSVRTVAAQLRA